MNEMPAATVARVAAMTVAELESELTGVRNLMYRSGAETPFMLQYEELLVTQLAR